MDSDLAFPRCLEVWWRVINILEESVIHLHNSLKFKYIHYSNIIIIIIILYQNIFNPTSYDLYGTLFQGIKIKVMKLAQVYVKVK
jgi:hypothetical protein